jgi:hypothetical protein
MADNTVSSTLVNNRICMARPGLNVTYCLYNFAAQGITTSTSLVIQMVPVPHKARILDVVIGNDGFVTGGFVVGDSSLSNRYITVTSLTTSTIGQIARMNAAGGAGFKISLTASDEPGLFDTVDLTLNGATSDSASGCIHMTVYYILEG